MNINELMGILNGYFSWNKGKAIKIKKKKHGRKAISYFRYGLDLLRDAALNSGLSHLNFLNKEGLDSPFITLIIVVASVSEAI